MLTLSRSTSFAVCLCVVVLTGCARRDDAAVDTMASDITPTPAPAPINLADVAGRWNMRSVPTTGDTSATAYVLTAAATTSGWTITFPGRAPIPARVVVEGDSIIIDAGPYASVRRKGVQVTTHTVSRLQGGNLVGTSTARYNVKTADSVLTLTSTGTRAP